MTMTAIRGLLLAWVTAGTLAVLPSSRLGPPPVRSSSLRPTSMTVGGGGAVSGLRNIRGVMVTPAEGGDPVDLGVVDSKTMIILATYAADFNG